MKKADTIKYDNRRNRGIYNTVDRENFTCLEVNIPNNSNFMKRAYTHAQKVIPNLNFGQANSSEIRELDIVEIDNLSGIIAELACQEVMNWRYGKEKIEKPESDSSYNQIDLKLYNGRTIEVRSSCVRNGLDFALFVRDKKNRNEQYFDVIGPYCNGYKKKEAYKDYYMRVLYECDKKERREKR